MSWPVSPAKQQALQHTLAQWQIRDADLEEHFVRSSGAGGQNVNKVATCVVLVHRPSGIEVKCQVTRSQAMNRFLARRLLCEKLAERMQGAQSEAQQRREKIRRQKRRRSRRAKEKMLADKHHRAQIKTLRKAPLT